MKRLVALIALLSASLASGQTAADKITAGRTALAAHDLPTAQLRFQEALDITPTAQAAAALLGITRSFNVVNSASSQTFLNRLGVSSSARDIYRWDASFTHDVNGDVVLPANFNLQEAADFWVGTLIPEGERARANLAVVTNASFLISLSTAETGLPAILNIDYGDVLMLRAWLRAAEGFGHLMAGQDLHLGITAAIQLAQGDLFTLQRLLADNPDFLKTGPISERTAARAALLEAIALYREASAAIRGRAAGLSRLFMIDAGDFANEAKFRTVLDQVERAITEPVGLGSAGHYATLAPAFTAEWSIRGALPTFSATGFDFTTVTDGTLGGMLVGYTREEFANALTAHPNTLPELGWEWVSPKPQGNALVRYAALPNGRQVVTGGAGTVFTSDNGTAWTVRRIPAADTLSGLAAGAGKVVATGGSSIYLSADAGVTWRRVYESYGRLRTVAFGGGLFVAVGDYGVVIHSLDGEFWQSGYTGSYSFNDILYSGSLFVAAGLDPYQDKAVIATSQDGVTWTNRFSAASTGYTFNGVAQGGGRLVVVGTGNQRAVSGDGLAWTSGAVLTGTLNFTGVAFRNGVFLAASDSGTMATSADGAAWAGVNPAESGSFLGVGAGADAMYVTGSLGEILRTTDAATFTRVVNPQGAVAGDAALFRVRAIDTSLYVTGAAGALARSSDGQNFVPLATGTPNSLWDIIKQDGVFYVVGNAGTILVSTDGTAWSARASGTAANLRSIAYLNGQFIVTGAAGTLLTSTDGVAWTSRGTGVSGFLYGAAYGNGRYVVTGGNNSNASHVLTSSDGATWTVRTIASASTFRGLVFHQGVFTTAGSDGALFRSVDGIAWEYVWTGAATNLIGLRVLEGRYYVLQAALGSSIYAREPQAALLVSSDGRHWTRCLQGTNTPQYTIELFQGRLYASGNGATILRTQPIPAVAAPALRILTASREARQGDGLVLGVAVNSAASVTYQWTKNGTVIAGATGPALELSNIQTGDAGSYVLTATNAAGSVSATPIVLTVNATPVAPVFATQPQSQTINLGLPATLSVVANGTTPMTYQWKKDGVAMAGATTATLAFAHVQSVSAGTYTVVVSNVAGSTTSAAATLTVDSNPAYTFSTLAGLANFTGTTDGTGSAARFNSPNGVAVDSAGTLYIADSFNHTIRKITAAGVVTTLAGGAGQPGNVNATGTAARFSYPRGVALDASAANLYVADNGNSVVRKIVLATGAVSQFASGIGANYLVLDSAGNVFLTASNNSVRKITPDGVVSVLAGSSTGVSGSTNGVGTAASFNGPQGIAIDAAGNLFIADNYNNLIRKIAPDATVATIAGQTTTYGGLDGPAASAGFYSPMGIAVDAAGSVFVSENYGYTIRKIAGGFVRTVGGVFYGYGSADGVGPDARFAGPSGLALDGSGNLYVADTYNHTIRKGVPSASPLAPAIGAQPLSQLAAAGGSVTFGISVSGVTPLSYQWLKNGANIAGATGASLTLTNVQASDAGSYSVQITNSHGTTLSGAAQLTLGGAPSITRQPVHQSVNHGQPATFTVEATGTPAPAYQWRKDGTTIAGATAASYTIASVTTGDVGSYTVVATNSAGTVTSSAAVLTVIVPPAITTQPVSLTVNAGATATFSVTATGTPVPVYQWRRNGTPLTGATAATLTLTNVQPAEAGTYAVAVSNAAGSVVSAGAVLTVNAPSSAPAITTQPDNQLANAGQSVTFTVVASGTGPLAYQWRKDGAVLTGATSASLTLTNVQSTNAGNYSVVVSNSAGTATSRDATLSVIPTGYGATHAVVGNGYAAGGTVQITTTITYPGTLTALGYQVLLPAGWSYVAGGGSEGDIKPVAGTVDLLEWAWTTVPASPATFTYTMNIPAGTTGARSLSGLVTTRPGPIQFMAAPDPLVISQITTHSADTDRNFRLSLLELTRVIELYNTRNGTTRTGCYLVATTTTEDGFTPEPTRASAAVVTLPRHHAADSNRDGKLSLLELTRVIELYNFRTGTTRTGQYRTQAGTEDNFAPGP